jgi:hypothetical protein
MKSGLVAALSTALLLPGCRTPRNVAETSYSTATSQPPATTETVTTTTASAPRGSLPPAPVRQQPPSTSTAAESRAGSTTAVQHPVGSEMENPHTTTTAQPASSPLDFPTAKPVEGKPGYVYSPFDSSKYVDVSGYAPGSKVKDPYSGKIFLVP